MNTAHGFCYCALLLTLLEKLTSILTTVSSVLRCPVVVMSSLANEKKKKEVKGSPPQQTSDKRATVDEVKTALKKNAEAALTANLSMESTHNVGGKPAVPAVRKSSEGATDGFGSKPAVPTLKKASSDPTVVLDALEKADTLDPKKASADNKEIVKTKKDTNAILDTHEKPVTLDPKKYLADIRAFPKITKGTLN
ncbi:hypothetical protein KIN20_033635 [Parelaphostrongylus tenuis]|uniref:Uncharacterized protein n=1 Tax=Parelaphostrongylus tenuis TaxID=148309 RepID=A0AAD5R8E5_PARTN|nr:hypothetical protein KIN20_033635 [Parelaphostrongylus tenuis]